MLRLVDGDINYRLTLEGDDFQAIDLPELNVRLTPRLLFEGQDGQLRISGEIGVPYLDLRGVRASPAVAHSQDVIVVGDAGLRLRHHFAEHWEVESVLGVNSGIDLFYVIKFKSTGAIWIPSG